MRPTVAIVDHGLGNLYSVKRACEVAGLNALITAEKQHIRDADAIILPGVGAFGDAMEALNRLDLVTLLKDSACEGKPFLGICLGVQLLMSESYEFGRHKGLNIFEGTVERFDNPKEATRSLKVPEICWNQIHPFAESQLLWGATPLRYTLPGEYMYFVHSYYVKPLDQALILSTTTYGDVKYCSSLGKGSVFACQFHPERSGTAGLEVYRGFCDQILLKKGVVNS